MESHVKILLLGLNRHCELFLNLGTRSANQSLESAVDVGEIDKTVATRLVAHLRALPESLETSTLSSDDKEHFLGNLESVSAAILLLEASSPSSCARCDAWRHQLTSARLPFDFPVVVCAVSEAETGAGEDDKRHKRVKRSKDDGQARACVKACDLAVYAKHFGFIAAWLREGDGDQKKKGEAELPEGTIFTAAQVVELLARRGIRRQQRYRLLGPGTNLSLPQRVPSFLVEEELNRVPTWMDATNGTPTNKSNASLARTSITTVERVKAGASELLARRFWKEQGLTVEGSRSRAIAGSSGVHAIASSRNSEDGLLKDAAILELVRAAELEIARLEDLKCEAEILEDLRGFAKRLRTFVCSDQKRSRLLQLEELRSCFEELSLEARGSGETKRRLGHTE